MTDFTRMLTNDGADTIDAARFATEQQLAAAAWGLARHGAVATITEPETRLIREADTSSEAETYFEADQEALSASIRLGDDPLGEAFTKLRTPARRRGLGAVYTPAPIVDAMVGWLAEHARPERVVDPGAGSGRFSLKAGQAFPEASLVAVELDPLAALVTRANLTAAGLDHRSQVIVDDYRQVELDSLQGVTAFIGNPPYVRHHDIDPRWKDWLRTSAASCGLPVSGLAGLHMHFFLATFLLARPGDVGTFVTSSEWLDVNYGRLLRAMLVDGLGGESIQLIDPRATPFEDAAATAAVTCFKVGSAADSVVMHKVDSARDLTDLTAGKPISKRVLRNAPRWSALLASTKAPPQGYVELGALCRVHRGAVTGSNATWITDANDPTLPQAVLFPSVTKARELFDAEGVLTSCEGLRTIIDLPVDLDELNPNDRLLAERFLRFAEKNGARSSYVVSHRKPWWSVRLRPPAPILATYMARRPPAFVRNPKGARHINVAHGIYPREAMADPVLDSLARSLNIGASTAQGRTYAGGLTKFEPSEMQRIFVPGPDLLTETSP